MRISGEQVAHRRRPHHGLRGSSSHQRPPRVSVAVRRKKASGWRLWLLFEALVRVTPLDDLQYWAGPESVWEFVDDRTPFVFRVEGWLEDGHIPTAFTDLSLMGPSVYRGLWCSIITRVDGSDSRVESSSSRPGSRLGRASLSAITGMTSDTRKARPWRVILGCRGSGRSK